MIKLRWLLVLTAVLALGSPIWADSLVTVDENGNGTIQVGSDITPLPSSFGPDPGPGGLNPVLIYQLPYFYCAPFS